MSIEKYKNLVNHANMTLDDLNAIKKERDANTESALMFIKTHKSYLQYLIHVLPINCRYSALINYFTSNIGIINANKLIFPLMRIGIFNNKILATICLTIAYIHYFMVYFILINWFSTKTWPLMIALMSFFIISFGLAAFCKTKFHLYNRTKW